MRIRWNDVFWFVSANLAAAFAGLLILSAIYSRQVPQGSAYLEIVLPPLGAGFTMGLLRPRCRLRAAAFGGFFVGGLFGVLLIGFVGAGQPESVVEGAWSWDPMAGLWFPLAYTVLTVLAYAAARLLAARMGRSGRSPTA